MYTTSQSIEAVRASFRPGRIVTAVVGNSAPATERTPKRPEAEASPSS